MNWTTLEDVSTLVSKGTTPTTLGYSFVPQGIPFLRAEDVTGTAIDPKAVTFRISEETDKALSRSRLQPGDLLITIAGTLGRVGYVPMNAPPLNCNQAVAFVRIKPEVVDLLYACFACRALIADLLNLQKIGTIGNLNLEQVRKFKIPLPRLCEQKRIATLIDRADRLRRARHYALELTDAFIPAAFLELFGCLYENEQKWPFEQLEKNAEIVSGVAKGQKYGDSKTVEVPYLRVANVQDGYLDLSEIKTIRVPPEDVEALRLEPGDIVMTEGGDFDKLGRGAIWPGGITDCIHQNHIFRVRLNQSALIPTFFAAFLRSPFAKSYFLRCSKQTTNLASINMTQLRATPTPLPPLPLQQKFAALVECVEHLRAVQREALRQAEHLFQALLHRAFSDTDSTNNESSKCMAQEAI